MKFEPKKPINPSSDITTASSKTTIKFFEPNENRSVFENVMNKVFSFGGITSASYDNSQKGHKKIDSWNNDDAASDEQTP
jgi:hypothetical protein